MSPPVGHGVPDHIHILIGMRPDESISDLVKTIKTSSSRLINDNKLTPSRFEWQKGFGAFSYSRNALPNLIRYIQNQKPHHAKKTFIEEYEQILTKREIEYDKRYIFQPPLAA
jgi:putative transposase